MLRGEAEGVLAGDPAVAACAATPVPLVSAAMGFTAVRRAARLGVGILFDSLSTVARCRTLTDAYRESGGPGPCVLIRRVWLGEPPRSRLDEQLDRYRSYTPRAAQAHWGEEDRQLVDGPDPATVVDGLVAVAQAVNADALNLRVHVPGVAPSSVREQIVGLGDEVVPRVRDALASSGSVRA
jgi:hypothetical protein